MCKVSFSDTLDNGGHPSLSCFTSSVSMLCYNAGGEPWRGLRFESSEWGLVGSEMGFCSYLIYLKHLIEYVLLMPTPWNLICTYIELAFFLANMLLAVSCVLVCLLPIGLDMPELHNVYLFDCMKLFFIGLFVVTVGTAELVYSSTLQLFS